MYYYDDIYIPFPIVVAALIITYIIGCIAGWISRGYVRNPNTTASGYGSDTGIYVPGRDTGPGIIEAGDNEIYGGIRVLPPYSVYDRYTDNGYPPCFMGYSFTVTPANNEMEAYRAKPDCTNRERGPLMRSMLRGDETIFEGAARNARLDFFSDSFTSDEIIPEYIEGRANDRAGQAMAEICVKRPELAGIGVYKEAFKRRYLATYQWLQENEMVKYDNE
jgi:hypothetical protein